VNCTPVVHGPQVKKGGTSNALEDRFNELIVSRTQSTRNTKREEGEGTSCCALRQSVRG